jgi:hypothetical protein
MGGVCSTYGEVRNPYTILVEIIEGKRSLGRLWKKKRINMKIDIKEVGWEGVDWI